MPPTCFKKRKWREDNEKVLCFVRLTTPEGLLSVLLYLGGDVPQLEQLLVKEETVHHGNVQKMVKKSLLPFHGLVVDAVVTNQCVRYIHTSHDATEVHYSVWNRDGLGLPHTSLFHLSSHHLSTKQKYQGRQRNLLMKVDRWMTVIQLKVIIFLVIRKKHLLPNLPKLRQKYLYLSFFSLVKEPHTVHYWPFFANTRLGPYQFFNHHFFFQILTSIK